MKAIKVSYLGPTDRRGSRIKATDGDNNSVTLSFDYAASDDDRNAKAAQALFGTNGIARSRNESRQHQTTMLRKTQGA